MTFGIKTQARLVGSLVVATWLAGCGKAEFLSGTKKSDTHDDDATGQTPIVGQNLPPDTGTITPTAEGNLGLTWQVDCTDTATAQQDSPSSAHLLNGAQGKFSMAKFQNGQLKAQGKICAPKARVRRVVFAVDVSGSMITNDPTPAGSTRCARLDAVESVIASFPQDGSVKFAVVTFDEFTEFSSGKFVGSLTEMKTAVDAMRPRRTWEASLCARINDTRYDVPLNEAQTLLNAEKVDGTYSQEIYLITDGEPDTANSDPTQLEAAKGLVQAKQLKDNNVSIATIMLGGTSDTILKQLTSDPALHRVASESKELEKALQDLSQNFYLKARLRLSLDGSDGTDDDALTNNAKTIFEFDLLTAMDASGAFSLPTLALDKDLLVGHGVKMDLRLLDRFGLRTHVAGGALINED